MGARFRVSESPRGRIETDGTDGTNGTDVPKIGAQLADLQRWDTFEISFSSQFVVFGALRLFRRALVVACSSLDLLVDLFGTLIARSRAAETCCTCREAAQLMAREATGRLSSA